MRFIRMMAISLALAMAPSGVQAAPPNLSAWVGTWFKLRGVVKGLAGGETGTLRAGTDRFVGYVKIWGYDAPSGTLQLDTYGYEQDLGRWVSRVLDLRWVAGSPQDFVGWTIGLGPSVLGLGARLKSQGARATFSSLGGLVAENAVDSGDVALVGGITLRGKSVTEDAVPVPVSDRKH